MPVWHPIGEGVVLTNACKERIALPRLLYGAVFLIQTVFAPFALAATAPGAPAAPVAPKGITTPSGVPMPLSSSGVHNSGAPAGSLSQMVLDLTSAKPVTQAGALTGFQPTFINVGGSLVKVENSTQLTASQVAAVEQKLFGGMQTLTVNRDGTAGGGTLTLNGVMSTTLGGLVVPHGVSVMETISSSSQNYSLGSVLQNFGLFNILSSVPGGSAVQIAANSIQNMSGGVISAGPNVNLTLAATQSIANSGTITTANNLTLLAPAVMNSGTLHSDNGNVSLVGSNGSLSVTGSGNIEAPNGAINVSLLNHSSASLITLTGGNYLSPLLNIDAAEGSVQASLQNVTGLVNMTACSTTFGAATPDLNLGQMNIKGDPTYFNTAGSLILNSVAATNGADLALLASGDVIVKGGTIDTTDPNLANNGNGGNLLIVAGANLAPSPANTSGNPDTNNTTITISAPSATATGGAISLVGVSAITTVGNAPDASHAANGGNVTMVAYSGMGNSNGLVPGTINTGNAVISTYSSGFDPVANSGGTSGNVTLIAGATADPSGGHAINVGNLIQTGQQVSSGGQVGGYTAGSIQLITATPTITGTITVLNGTQGGGGSFGAGAVQQGSISFGSLNAAPSELVFTYASNTTPLSQPNAGNVTVQAGTYVTGSTINAEGNLGSPNGGSNIYYAGPGGPGGNGGNVSITAGTGITLSQILADGGSGGGGTGAAGKGGHGGNISLISPGGNIIMNANTVALVAAGGAGQHSGGDGGAGGDGGSVTVLAPGGYAVLGLVDVGGGGGAGGIGGTVGGNGGAGGNGGTVNIMAQNIIETGYITASGGGGGGAGGTDAVNGNGGGGGGGGSSFNAGIGGWATSGVSGGFTNGGAGGGGGGGGLDPALGGASAASTSRTSNPYNQLTGGPGVSGSLPQSEGAGGAGGGFASGGQGGSALVAGGDSGGKGGDIGTNGAADVPFSGGASSSSGGAAGTSGVISLTAKTILVQGTPKSTLPVLSITQTLPSALVGKPTVSDSLTALGPLPGGTPPPNVQILSYGSTYSFSPLLISDLNLADTTNKTALSMSSSGAPFAVLYTGYGNGTVGNIDTNTTNINGVSGTGVNSFHSYSSPTTGGFTLVENGNGVFFHGGANASTATPAELLSLISMYYGIAQSLTLSSSGAATGGFATLYPFMVPTTGLSTLNVPSGVSLTSALPVLTVAVQQVTPLGPNDGMATIAGNLFFPSVGTLSAVGINGGGTGFITSGAGLLTLNATGGDIAASQGSTTPVNTTTGYLYVSASGSAYINNTLPSKFTALNILSSSAGSTFNLTNFPALNSPYSSIIVAQDIVAANTSLTVAGSGAVGLTINAPILSPGGSVSLAVPQGTAGINQVYGTILANSLTVNSPSGAVTLGPTAYPTAVSQLTITNAHNLTIQSNSVPLQLNSSSVAGALTLTAPQISVSGNSSFFTATFTTGSFSMLPGSSLLATIGGINVASAGGDLNLSGQGSLTASLSGVSFTSSTGNITIAPSTFYTLSTSPISTSTFNAPFKSIFADPSALISLNGGSLALNSNAVFNPLQFSQNASAPTINIPSTGPSVGTIFQSGDVVLSSLPSINNASGKNIFIAATGNIEAGSLTFLGSYSNTGAGGDITLLAGVSLASTSPSTVNPNANSYNITAGANSGSINLAGVPIYSFSGGVASGSNAGNITLVANNGSIFTGAIYAMSSYGHGGNVTAIAPGGVIIGGPIVTTGATGGGNVTIAATTPVLNNVQVAGNASFSDIMLSSGSSITPASGPAQTGAAATVMGSISTNSTTTSSNGGGVSILSDTTLLVNGSITTTGNPAGSVSLTANNGGVTVNGNILTNGMYSAASSVGFANAGNAGNVQVNGNGVISVLGEVDSAGGSAYGAGNGGNAGTISMQTSNAVNSSVYNGLIKVGLFVDAAGGASYVALVGSKGGAGANVTLTAGAVQVFSLTYANGNYGSIITSGGTNVGGTIVGGVPDLEAGTLTVNTYAFQPVPADLNETSATATDVLMPGAAFVVGNPAANGTAYSLVAGPSHVIAYAPTVPITASTPALQAKVNIGGVGTNLQITEGTGTTNYSLFTTGGNRMMITPSEALAFYQVSEGQTQTVNVSASRTAAAGSTISLPQADLPQSFSSFNITNTTVTITGNTPTLNISAALSPTVGANGAVTFANSGAKALIFTGSDPFTIQSTGAISFASGTNGGILAFQSYGAMITNNGLIDPTGGNPGSTNSLMFLAPALSFELQNNATGIVKGSTIILPSNGSSSLTYIANAATGTFSPTLTFQSVQVPTAFGSVSASFAPGAIGTQYPSLYAQFAGSTGPTIAGNATGITALSITNATSAALTIGSLAVSGALTVVSSGNLTVANGGITTNAPTSSALGNINIYQIGGSTLSINGNVTANGGSITVENTVASGSIAVGNNVLISTNVSSPTKSTNGQVVLAVGGGPVALNGLSSGTTPGGITVNQTTSGTAYFGQNPARITGSTGATVNLVKQNVFLNVAGSSGSISLGQNATITADPTYVQAGATTFNVTSARGIPAVYGIAPMAQAESSSSSGAAAGNAVQYLAHVFVEGAAGAQVLMAQDSANINSRFGKLNSASAANQAGSEHAGLNSVTRAASGITLHSGDMFLHPLVDTTISTPVGDVSARKDSLFSVDFRDGRLRVVACSGPGDILLHVGARTISLLPGEEVVISDHLLSAEERTPADGLGRRAFKQFNVNEKRYVTLAEVSLPSMLANKSSMLSILHPTGSVEKRTQARLLKAAAVLQQVSAGHGPYASRKQTERNQTERNQTGRDQTEDSPYQAVGYERRGD